MAYSRTNHAAGTPRSCASALTALRSSARLPASRTSSGPTSASWTVRGCLTPRWLNKTFRACLSALGSIVSPARRNRTSFDGPRAPSVPPPLIIFLRVGIQLFGGRLFTLFSATNYCGNTQNSGAILLVGKDLNLYVRRINPQRGANAAALWDNATNVPRPPSPMRRRW